MAYLERLSRPLAWLSFALLAGAALVTAADILLRRAGGAVVGVVDLVQLCVMAGAWLAIAYAFLGDGHVTVDLLTDRLSARAAALCRALGGVLAVLLMAAIAWYGFGAAAQQHAYGARSHTMGIPILWYWAPLLAGAALSILAAALAALHALAAAIRGDRP